MARIHFRNGETFIGSLEGERAPEVFGHCEKDGRIVAGTVGWFRTADVIEAAERMAYERGTSLVGQS